MRKNEHVNSLSNYIISSATDVQNGKDIRLYKMKGLLQKWCQKLLEESKMVYRPFADFAGKCGGEISFLSQMFAGFVYIYLGASVFAGAISVGNVLRNVNLKFNVNKRFAIVGQNGAGKTTIIKLLCRLYEPTEGEILLNGINIEKYDYAEYTGIFSVVFQDFKLFPLPLDENIAGSDEVDRKRCLEVIEQVGLKETVMNWPERERTRLYKNLGDGINVSGGEAQKIAIARALYKDSPFVIMDEPTAALDPIAEAEIYENFNEMIHDKTAIFISHRMSSCKFCDEIIVFENGEIVQKGEHVKLVEEAGLYQQLWNAQAQYYGG